MLQQRSWRELRPDSHHQNLFLHTLGKLHPPSPCFPTFSSHHTSPAMVLSSRFKLSSHPNPIIYRHQSSQFKYPIRKNQPSPSPPFLSSPPPPPPPPPAFQLQIDPELPSISSISSGFHSHSLLTSTTISPPPATHSSHGTREEQRQGHGALNSFFNDVEREGDIEKALNAWFRELTPKELTVILKQQRDWTSALRVFQWMKLQEDYVPDVIHYNIILRRLGKAQKWDQLRLCWIEMAKDSVFPTNNTYGMLIDVYGKAGLVKEAILWLKHMKIRGIFPDEVTMNTLVRVLKDAREFDRADRFYKGWCSGRVELDDLDFDSVALEPGSNPMSPKHFLLTELFKAGGRGPPKKVPSLDEEGLVRKPQLAATYNTLIDLYGKAGRLKDASDALSEMLRSGVAPDTFTFNTMINICRSHGQFSEAESLLNKMEERGVYPDTKTFNIFISLYGDMRDITGVLRWYRKMKEACLHPDAVTYRAILKLLCERNMVQEVEDVMEEMEKLGACVDEHSLPVIMKMYVNEGLLEQAKVLLEKCCAGRQISSKSYAAIIDSYAEKGLWAEAEAVFFGKGDVERKKDVIEYNVMIKAYGTAKHYDSALLLFGTMKSNGIWPDACTYNSLIQMLSGGDLIDDAMDLLAKMQEAGFIPGCPTFCAVMSCNARLGRITDAVNVYEEMVRLGVKPNEIVYGCLINAFAESGKVEEALSYLNEMEKSGLTANQIIYTSLLQAYRKASCWIEARELYAKMKHLDGGPGVIASNCMIAMYSVLGMVSLAEAIFDSLRQSGCADCHSFFSMMDLYENMGQVEKAIDVAREMQQSGLITDFPTFNKLMWYYVNNGDLRWCGDLLHQMISQGVLPNRNTFRVIFIVLKKGGFPSEAVEQLKKNLKDGKPYSLQATVTSVFSVLEFHAWALEYWETFKRDGVLDTSAYNVAIYAYSATGNVGEALNMFKEMQYKGLEPDLVTYIHLVDCYEKAGLVEGLKRMQRLMINGEIEPSKALFEAIIAAYRNMGKTYLADLAAQDMQLSIDSEDEHDSDNDYDSDNEEDESSVFNTEDEYDSNDEDVDGSDLAAQVI